MRISIKFEFLIVVGVSLLFSYAYWRYQPQIIAGNGNGWDGIAYHQLYNYFSGLTLDLNVAHPFCKRIGLPFLAALLPFNPTSSFRYLNISFGFFCILICFLALRGRFNFSVSFAAIIPLCCYLFSPIRFANFYPYFVDPPSLLLFALSLLALVRKNYLFALGFLLISTFFRESGLYYSLALTGSLYLLKEISRKIAILFIGLIAISAMAAKILYFGPCEGSQISVALNIALTKLSNFSGVLRIIAALSLTLAPFTFAKSGMEIRAHEPIVSISIVFLILSIIMSSLGGYDTTRIFFSAYPLYVYFLCSLIEKTPKTKVYYFSVAGMIANSFAMKIPEPDRYWPSNEILGFFSFFPDYSHMAISAGIIAYWTSCFLMAKLFNLGGLADGKSILQTTRDPPRA